MTKILKEETKLRDTITKDTIREISKTYDLLKDVFFTPINRRTKLINFDKSANYIMQKGWKGFKDPNGIKTPDTILFNKDEIIPVEIKWKDLKNTKNPGTSGRQLKSLGRKLATFVYNIHKINNRIVKEYWVVLNYDSKDEKKNIETSIINKGIKYLEKYGETKDTTTARKILKKIKVTRVSFLEFENKDLRKFKKEPKWFLDFYMTENINKPKTIKKTTKSKTITKPVEKPSKKIIPKEKPTKKVGKTSEEGKELSITIKEFELYKQQQSAFQNKLISTLEALVKEIKTLKKKKH